VSEAGEQIVLDVPAATEHLRLVRLLVSSLATSHGADLEDLEDLRIATGEVCAYVIATAGPDDRLVATARVHPDGDGTPHLVLRATVPGLRAPEPLDELSSMVLDAASGAHGSVVDDDGTSAWFDRATHQGGPVDPSVD
jgi:serine/threonine-protein kinase RsbW